jgi:hypothetical protein
MRYLLLPFCVVALSAAPAVGQEKAGSPVGRYQTAQVMPAHFALIDTTTGECWVEDDAKWIDLKFPVKETKVTAGRVGRFRLDALRDKEGKSISLVVCDTADGRCWRADYYPESMKWRAVGSPGGK